MREEGFSHLVISTEQKKGEKAFKKGSCALDYAGMNHPEHHEKDRCSHGNEHDRIINGIRPASRIVHGGKTDSHKLPCINLKYKMIARLSMQSGLPYVGAVQFGGLFCGEGL